MALKKRRTEKIAKKSYDWFEKNVRSMMSSELLSLVGISSDSLSLGSKNKINMDLYQGTMGVPSTFATQGDSRSANTNNSVTGITLDSLSKIEYKSSADPYSRVGIRQQIEDSSKIHYHSLGGGWIKDPSIGAYSTYPVVPQEAHKVKDTCEKRKEPWSEK
tara:strand:- start:87 stop:569 length:483 start_codon:yes stop_codon:yes gene_type:complete